VTIGGNGPVIEAGLAADVAVLSFLAAFVVTSFSAVGAAFGLPQACWGTADK
jgi:hypothetical protein